MQGFQILDLSEYKVSARLNTAQPGTCPFFEWPHGNKLAMPGIQLADLGASEDQAVLTLFRILLKFGGGKGKNQSLK